ncbi:NAD(P)-dependent dehydrogenase (short-subunit alcohol dehydrogenase family) [Modicisalibacter xianhensis]|uniref:NAD(P)-dependent dehydrogenase (Short-subunit alcohol dehydrogenase family) n=1 Tax=Modicisalibacter xianhensis TaxID=442341 RepID=A0A4R8FXG4_9GAMM|nr:oxidoreductase [Halomonas xianhensis]TDX31647.1 NAD(P)-dependent dehydrogenase (short-subunit alcohol dehydrogenase family) [Halomonas xianhensis]
MTDHASQAKLAVVTGANTGLGFETAKGLVRQGYRVVIAARNPDKGHAAVEALRGGCLGAQVRFEPLDLDSLASVHDFAASLHASESSLDLLVNNAGVLALPTRKLTQEGFERQLGVNYLGHFLLTSRLLPLLVASPAPRVVQLSSLAHRGGRIDFDDLHGERHYDPWRAYRQSKLAMLLFSQSLQQLSETEGWGLMSVAAHPGLSRTALFEHGVTSRGMMGRLFRLVLPFISQSAPEGARPTLFAATAGDVRPGDYIGPAGFAETRGASKRARIGKHAQDSVIAERLWHVSCELTGAEWRAA